MVTGDEGDHLRPVWQRPQQVRLLQAPRVPQRCCRQRQVRQISWDQEHPSMKKKLDWEHFWLERKIYC